MGELWLEGGNPGWNNVDIFLTFFDMGKGRKGKGRKGKGKGKGKA